MNNKIMETEFAKYRMMRGIQELRKRGMWNLQTGLTTGTNICIKCESPIESMRNDCDSGITGDDMEMMIDE